LLGPREKKRAGAARARADGQASPTKCHHIRPEQRTELVF